jgi:hypothetical protein
VVTFPCGKSQSASTASSSLFAGEFLLSAADGGRIGFSTAHEKLTELFTSILLDP